MNASSTHLVLLPSYNTGPRLIEVIRAVMLTWRPVMVVIDGSTDSSELPVQDLARHEPDLTVLVLPENQGKGAAVLAGAQAALARGYTHALVMDADGQHPTESIQQFMTISLAQPAALVLGRPVFPPNIPLERLHGRKLSTVMVRLEMLGAGIGDALFGFRVYPLAELMDALGHRRSGRRYDFDTEAAVRLGWEGVPLLNVPAPVRYFSREEGGVTHFRYLRDNILLTWMHARLLGEFLAWRWITLLARRWRGSARGRGPIVVGALMLALTGAASAPVSATEQPAELPAPEREDAWADLRRAFAQRPDTRAQFTELRHFPFRRAPVELKGVVRVSNEHGLSLHYADAEERTVILDEEGMLVRTDRGDSAPPVDPRAGAANEALLHILRLDLPALEQVFVLNRNREESRWTLELTPREASLQRAIERIVVVGEADHVRFIEIRRSARQTIEIHIAQPESVERFPADELAQFFR